ncbi:hypothetical protein ACXU4B_03630 [Dyella soli]|uniref:DUF4760 domain-containing protein n=1 Tax=Dyella soli TaxID=522319 RepID=A0A4R0YML3_9GAMM|nr:hypothetical protein [Dyella soli]TCI10129.1 hypothetical protein EZM97_14515 [Dyella soli]
MDMGAISIWISGTSVLIALSALIVTIVQHRATKAKLKLDLFERRYAIFEIAWQYLSKQATDSTKDPREGKFSNIIPQAEFLMGDEIAEYMRLAQKKTVDKWFLEDKQKRQTATPEENASVIELMSWFENEAKEGLRRKFAPYLDFHVWK